MRKNDGNRRSICVRAAVALCVLVWVASCDRKPEQPPAPPPPTPGSAIDTLDSESLRFGPGGRAALDPAPSRAAARHA